MMEQNNPTEDDSYEPEYETCDLMVANQYAVRVLVVIPPPLEYMVSLHSNQHEISGQNVWCGSLRLIETLVEIVKNNSTFYQKPLRILELGCGTGLVGMVISKILPESIVVLTDGDDESLTLLQRNLQDPKNQIDFHKVQATCLRWNENMEDFDKWCRKHNSYYKNLNSSTATSPENLEIFPDEIEISNSPSDPVYFDIILAGDVLYKPELPNAFFDTVTRYLAPTTGVLWLCHVPRSSVTHELVEEIARDKGFSIHQVRTHFSNCPETIGGISEEDRVHEDWENAIVYQLQRS